MREKQIEQSFVKEIQKNGGLALKFVSPGLDGVPDRLVLLPGGRTYFLEVKAPGQKPRPLQVRRIEQLRRLGFPVYVIDSLNQISGVVDDMTNYAANEKEVTSNAVQAP